MFFERWLQKAREWLRVDDGIASEEKLLQEEFAELDAKEPGWDRKVRVHAACGGLRAGLPRETLVGIYGEAMVVEAERLNELDKTGSGSRNS